ncbi:hypothetical protein TUM20985_07250 [Mycobacterium antarcticum]|nr:hypothetical protein TUM20985_07250 [Mycolicibacterium sp. TUM20985]GLP73636.1 hypothetical protein TUM20983_07460 [Mycolicibacterium sp. TUM20983]GLP79314.1 hypothetical protein TUM20984_07340 [Mycolicibacterium sp. TUM20984]
MVSDTFGFLEVVDSVDDDLLVLELLDVAVVVSEPQPDRTTASAVAAAATPVRADALMC